MKSKIYVEWVNGTKADHLYKTRRSEELASARQLDPNAEEGDILLPLEDDSKWNWVAMEECIETHITQTIEEAKEWAEANFELDYFNRPVVKRDIWNTDEPETSATTVRRILYEGGGEWTE